MDWQVHKDKPYVQWQCQSQHQCHIFSQLHHNRSLFCFSRIYLTKSVDLNFLDVAGGQIPHHCAPQHSQDIKTTGTQKHCKTDPGHPLILKLIVASLGKNGNDYKNAVLLLSHCWTNGWQPMKTSVTNIWLCEKPLVLMVQQWQWWPY